MAYCIVDLLGYLGQRKKRLENFQADTAARAVSYLIHTKLSLDL